jgi:lipopolysaccharide heptosyltransferase III
MRLSLPDRQAVSRLRQYFFLKIYLFCFYAAGAITLSAECGKINRRRFCFCDFEIQYAEMRRLIIRPGAIGDFILSLPAMECLRTGYLEVWTTARNVPLVRFADRAQPISTTGLDLLGVTKPPDNLIVTLRRFDSIVSWYGSNRADFRRLMHSLGLPFTFFPALPAEGSPLHATEFYLQQVRSLVDCPSDGIPRIQCDVARENFAVIQPFSGSPRKNWPLDRFRQVAAKLEQVMPVRWCAGPEDPPLAEAVRIEDLYELACWLARARLYIGNDSGITHLAAAVGTPVLALFGPTDPAVWAPRGPHVRVARWSGFKSEPQSSGGP